MTDHSPLPVLGYTEQPTEKVQLVNALKQAEERVLRMLDTLGAMGAIDKRWLAIGRTDIERGFMAANRSVFRPERVKLPTDA